MYITFAKGLDPRDFFNMNPLLAKMALTVAAFCAQKGLKCEVTSMIRTAKQDRMLGARSKTHQEGRAIDISIKGFTTEDIAEIVDIVEIKHLNVGALSSETLKPRPIYVHDNGNGPHIHLQVQRMHWHKVDGLR